MCLGMLDGAYILASETCALDLIEAEYIRDIEPGELIQIGPNGIESIFPFPKVEPAHCVFEYIYFARPDSMVFGNTVNGIRKELGRQLARETGVEADVVIPVPDSGVPAALGYAEEARLPYENGLIRNHYVGRTFIEPQQTIRHFGVKIKLNPVREALAGEEGRRGRRFDRPRDDVQEDRQDDPAGGREGRSTCESALRRPHTPVSTESIPRPARS